MKEPQHLRAGWPHVAGEIGDELAGWRREHPRATLREIEAVVQAALERLQARYLTDLVHASGAADLARSGEQPRCSACGGALVPRGQQARAVLTPGQRAPLRLERTYAVCSACGAGLFPPG